ncbi:MAG TPA: hypothetical protein VG917_00645 [Patescibacteria group bacterium]|nr:hypothetical protein [Patescibacteria group bacterium]
MNIEGRIPNPFVKEAADNRVNAILDARNITTNNFWLHVTRESVEAYKRLNYAIYAGVDVADPEFVHIEGSNIALAFPAISASLQQRQAESAFDQMIDFTLRAPEGQHVVSLPPLDAIVSPDPVPHSLEDAIPRLPEEYSGLLPQIDQQTRTIVGASLVMKENYDKIWLNPTDSKSGFPIIRPISTIIPSVYLAYAESSVRPKLPDLVFIMNSPVVSKPPRPKISY